MIITCRNVLIVNEQVIAILLFALLLLLLLYTSLEECTVLAFTSSTPAKYIAFHNYKQQSFSVIRKSKKIRCCNRFSDQFTTRPLRKVRIRNYYPSTKKLHYKYYPSNTVLSYSLSDNNPMNPTSIEILRDWVPLDPETLSPTKCLIEQTLCVQPDNAETNHEYQQPQLAKDYDYANAILDAWKDDELTSSSSATTSMWNTEWKSIRYYSGNVPLYGHYVRRRRKRQDLSLSTSQPNPLGILFFHTGAGPHDIFLLWKAAALVNTLIENNNEDDNNEIIVFITDSLSDDSGWGWDDDRTYYTTIYDTIFRTVTTKEIMSYDENDILRSSQQLQRPNLQPRINAAVNALQTEIVSSYGSPNDRKEIIVPLAALGWCLGGYSVLELSKMKIPDMKAMATFHGVFTTIPLPLSSGSTEDEDDENYVNGSSINGEAINGQDDVITSSSPKTEVLICHGYDDVFVSDDSIQLALETFRNNRNIVSLLQLQDAKHGFTNPAQDYNKRNPTAFGYHDESAKKAWRQTLGLLRRRLLPKQ